MLTTSQHRRQEKATPERSQICFDKLFIAGIVKKIESRYVDLERDEWLSD